MFPYVMYTARPVGDENRTTLSPGRYEPAAGHYVKYEAEFRAARAYATIIHNRADWESGVWRLFDPESAAFRPVSLSRRLWHACQRAYYDRALILSALRRPEILSALRRPRRVARFLNFCKWVLGRTVRGNWVLLI
jgi:hypothetical protein